MAAVRLSRLQTRILRWLAADEQRTRGMITSSHPELVAALPSAKGNISHSLRRLETQGLIVMLRTPGGKTESVYLTASRSSEGLSNLQEVMNKEEHYRETSRLCRGQGHTELARGTNTAPTHGRGGTIEQGHGATGESQGASHAHIVLREHGVELGAMLGQSQYSLVWQVV